MLFSFPPLRIYSRILIGSQLSFINMSARHLKVVEQTPQQTDTGKTSTQR